MNGDPRTASPVRQPPTSGSGQYRTLRRNMTLLMILVTLVPLALMAVINHFQYTAALRAETIAPLRDLLNRTRNAGDIFLAERRSAVSYIASAYGYEELSDPAGIGQVFQVMRREFGGFVDLGLIDESGMQVSYAGPFELIGKDYRDQEWFEQALARGTHVSDVFTGYRKQPHFVIAVRHDGPDGRSWIVRATIDREKFDGLIAPREHSKQADTFVVNRAGILQTPSRTFGDVLDRIPVRVTAAVGRIEVEETTGPDGAPILLGSTTFETLPFTLVAIQARGEAWKPLRLVTSAPSLVFAGSLVLVLLVAHRLATRSVRRIEVSERAQRMAFHEMAHSHKLASIGRLAAGVAHEINNPLAIVDQKAGLMQDLLEREEGFPRQEKFRAMVESILAAVDRCRTITHRLLGFARRMDVVTERLEIDRVVREALSFLEKEAEHRNVTIHLDLESEPGTIVSDHGQLQQVFLNITNNALAAVGPGGNVWIRTRTDEGRGVVVEIADDGPGMSEDVRRHIFEPFFTTKPPGQGTGLGLSITYGIVKRLGGEIQVESEPGKGARFTVRLPATAPEARS